MTERVEQRYCIKFCQKLGDSQSETIRKIQQVFGEDAMGVTQVKEWFNRFKSGRTSAESDQRSGRPQTARSGVVERVRNLVMADRRSTVREIAQEVGVSKDSAHAILRDDLNMHKVAAKFVPKLLSLEQKDIRFEVAQDLLDTANTDPQFLNTVITGDESWVYGNDPETKRQSSQWKHPESPRPKKARQVPSKMKIQIKEEDKTPPVISIKQEAPTEIPPIDPKIDVNNETPDCPIEFICVDETKPKIKDEVEVFEEIVEPTPSVTPSIEGDMSESTTSLPGDSQDMQAAPTGFEADLFRDESADSHGKAHKSKKKKKEKKHKKHKKHKHEHKDKLDKLDKFIQEENLSSGSSNPPSPASPSSMGGSVSNSMASNMSF